MIGEDPFFYGNKIAHSTENYLSIASYTITG